MELFQHRGVANLGHAEYDGWYGPARDAVNQVVVLAGGVGAARFVRGLQRVIDPARLTLIVNTADDLWWHGLYVSPDLDTVMYWLAGIADEQRGWGIRGDTFAMHESLQRLTHESWFRVGDRDLATHVIRTARLRQGASLHEVTDELARRYRVKARLLPMSDDPVATRLRTDRGDSHFQEYFVRDGFQPEVHEIYWTGLDDAVPAPGVAEAVTGAAAVLIAPSNPIISIGPILKVRGLRQLLQNARSKTVAISPLIGGAAVKGPTVPLMRAAGLEPTPAAVAAQYRDIAAGFVLDQVDADYAPAIEALGYRVAATDTLLDDPVVAQGVAERALGLAQEVGAAA
jgi:LPPG:FO 2-phospho-L-lactate transferase